MSKSKEKTTNKPSKSDRFKLQLDYKTIIVVRSKEAVERWLSKFPNAKLLAM
jgi:hypothetical protein